MPIPLTVDLKREFTERIADSWECWTEGTHDDAELIQVVFNIMTEIMDKWNNRLIDALREEFSEIGVEVTPSIPKTEQEELAEMVELAHQTLEVK